MRLRYFTYTLLAGLILIGCQNNEHHQTTAESLPAVEVTSYVVVGQKEPLLTEVVGTVRAVKEAVIAAKVIGTISEMPVVLGSVVKEGDLLVKISAEEISAKVVQAQTQLEQAKRNLDREKKLLEKQAATPESVKSLEEMHRVAEAAYREASTMLSYTKIIAPFDGVITLKQGNVGDLATPGTPLLHLEDNSKLQVVASVPEALVLQIKQGDTLNIHIPVLDTAIQGTVTEVAPAADPMTRTAPVKLDIKSEPGLRSGQFARVIIPSAQKKTIFVPTVAISTFGQMEQIFTIKDNKAHLRLVRTGFVTGDQTEILAGLNEGETVAITKGTRLIDGQPITISK